VRVATWNINNITKRLDLLLDWLARTKPDVVALQELKTPTADFPAKALKDAGYESLAVGQRSWNGVALLARGHEPLPVATTLPGDPKDKEARYLEAAIHGVLFGCLYLPNGNPQPGPKFDYKLRWFERMRRRAAELWASGQPVVLLGDWNVVPTDADIYKPDTWRDNALLQPQPREAYGAVLSQGWTDALKRAHPAKVPFTFWDYRRSRWERDAGLRIDHILVGARLTVADAGVDREERGKENASDHAPVWAEVLPAKASSMRKSAKFSERSTRVQDANSAAQKPDLSRAVKAPLPAKLEPQLATLASGAPTGGVWIAENKFDGYRMLARISGAKARLITRNGNDWTDKLKTLAARVEALGVEAGWLDGEIVVLNEAGVPDFNMLQNAIDNSRSKDIVYFLFDLPFIGDTDLRKVPLVARRAVLKELMDGRATDHVKFSEAFDAPPAQLLEAARQMGLEGVMLKRADAPYVSSRTDTWLKLKCQLRQEFVAIGFTDRSGAAAEVGGMLLGYHEDGKLRYGGSVGTGWDAKTGHELHQRLAKLETDKPAVDASTVKPGRWSKRASGTERWVKPQMVVEVAFSEWTPDGHVRHPTFRGVRTDKPGKAITRDRAMVGASSSTPSPPRVTSVKVTNPERVIDPSTGLKKVELVRYYESIAEWMLPHLKGRPVSLVRAPQGISGEQFFQKHPETKMPGMTELDPALWPGHSPLLAVNSADSLVAAAQMNTVEFHTWNSTIRRINQPDRIVFDLDPGEGVSWAHLQEAAVLTRAMLTELGLEGWLKTSGGKGLHVVVPLAPKLDYEVVKGFSHAVVQHMAKTIPQRFVSKSGGTNRVGQIFIDYLRNGHGQTTAAAFSARARPGMGVSMPVAWEELPSLKSGSQWTIVTAREYLSFQQDDPWAAFWKNKQTLTTAMRTLGYEPAKTST
jgi:bifunctional non-homologous end joining protein LigD